MEAQSQDRIIFLETNEGDTNIVTNMVVLLGRLDIATHVIPLPGDTAIINVKKAISFIRCIKVYI